ncbi:chemotaxis response regulator protein-glutamate methylesterase [Petroclostridium sp. X23]|uniref:protein-glutamate methylesterase/protein-glutamine glutaminase n=1 Tax=Petroclostridium sp. X23 TaxID=3045146 RepID=UPI0024ACE669|nr:chemotaxis response regulator protein-glutamate methylesterase [Petroclostridium sp. X23]WHH58956.1 chemotaxis response regulator protein-glutamate methylesterase [Petroclostridium sp. X23]
MSIRVLVVDDSAFIRKIVTDILSEDPYINVLDIARNGREALDKIKLLSPDVVTLDVEMPVMDGLECLKEIMNVKPVPVIMVSSLTTEGANATIKALELGAIDFIAKPRNIFDVGNEKVKKEIIEKIKIAKNSIVRPSSSFVHYTRSEKKKVINSQKLKHIVAIGTSTGGPRALQQVIPPIPGNIPAAFVVVQHMPQGFTKSLAARLDSMSELNVKEAEDGDIITSGYAYIAPGSYHMVFQKESNTGQIVIRLNKNAPEGGHRPSVNVMMSSLADTGQNNIIGVIMTGMGADGCEGLKRLKTDNGAHIIAQDEKSCVVYGMPKAAVQAGIVDKVIALNDISNEIIRKVGV